MVSTTFSTHRVSEGFVRQVCGGEARRQLRMAVGVVVVMSFGIVTAAVTVGSHQLPVKREMASVAPLTTMHADSNVVGAKAI